MLEWFYPVVFELRAVGRDAGQARFGLKVVMDNGLPVTPAASFTRNLLRVADFLPFGYGFAIVSMLLRRDCKRLGDIAAGTLVVHEPRAVPADRARRTWRRSRRRRRSRRTIRRRSSRWRRARRR